MRSAEWAEYMSTKQQLSVLGGEKIRVNARGGEVSDGQRRIVSQEAPIISATTARNLPRRVGIAFMPGRIATKIYTSPPQVDNRYASWEDRLLGSR